MYQPISNVMTVLFFFASNHISVQRQCRWTHQSTHSTAYNALHDFFSIVDQKRVHKPTLVTALHLFKETMDRGRLSPCHLVGRVIFPDFSERRQSAEGNTSGYDSSLLDWCYTNSWWFCNAVEQVALVFVRTATETGICFLQIICIRLCLLCF